MASFARDSYVATNLQTAFTITYAYLSTADIVVKQNGTTLTITTHYTISGATMTLVTGATTGDIVLLTRSTSQSTRLTDYTVPSTLLEADLDNDSLQAFYMAQEAIDEANLSIGRESSGVNWDAETLKILNVVDPTTDQMAATKKYVDDTVVSGGNVPTPDDPAEDDYILGATGSAAFDWRSPATVLATFGAIFPDFATLTAVASDGQMIVGTGAGVFAYESGDTLADTVMGVIGPDLKALGAVADNEIMVGTSAGVFAYESGATLRTSMGLAIGSNVQAWDAQLDDIAALSPTKGNILIGDGANWKLYPEFIAPNLVINGDMRISQRGTSFAALVASQYTLDRMEWIDTGTTSAVVTITQDTDVPTAVEAGTTFRNSLKIDVTTAEDLVGANAVLMLSHKIEAKNCMFFGHGATGALSARLHFWIKSTKTGIFTVNLDRDDASEKFSTEFTISSTNTWEFKEVTIPGDTGGTAITNDFGIGLTIQIMMAVGGDGDTSTKDAWNANGATELATANQVNLLDNSANNVLIAGLTLSPGTITTRFDHQQSGRALADCHRYYYRMNDIDTAQRICDGHNNTTTQARATVYVPVIMRGNETTRGNGTVILDFNDFNIRESNTAISLTGASGAHASGLGYTLIFNDTGAGFTAGAACAFESEANNAFIEFESEI